MKISDVELSRVVSEDLDREDFTRAEFRQIARELLSARKVVMAAREMMPDIESSTSYDTWEEIPTVTWNATCCAIEEYKKVIE